MRRVLRVAGGIVLLLGGALVVLGALGAAALASCDDLSSDGSVRLRSPGVAVLVRSGNLVAESPSGGMFCGADHDRLTVRVRARPAGGERLFVGVADARQLARYLGPARHDRARLDLLVSSARHKPAGRAVARVAPPAAQPFWLAVGGGEGKGARLALGWTEPSSFRLAVMNADGTPGVEAAADIEVEVAGPTLWPFWLAALGGLAVALAGLRLALRGGRVRR